MRTLRRLPLAARAPLLAAALMALVGIVASSQVLAALTRAQEARLAELARLHVDGLSVALGPAVLRRDVWEVFDTLDRAARSGGGRMALTAVADEAGRVLAATDPRRAPVDSPIDTLAAGAQPLDRLRIAAATDRLRVVAPLFHQGRPVGRIVSELDVADLAAERRRALLLLLAGNTAATLLLAVGGYLAIRRLLRPLDLLAARMEAGAPAPIPPEEAPPGDHEVARLFRTWNEMAGAVEAKAEAERRMAERERLVSLGRLSSSLAHEINNPLGGLLAAADTIRRFADRPDAVREAAGLIERGLRHLRDVARAALDHNRLDLSAAPLRSEDFEDLRLLVAVETERSGQRLDWRAAAGADDVAGLPAGPVRQIALNLLLNASAAAGAGGLVMFEAEAEPGTLRLVVTDDGPGMPEAALRRLLTSEPATPGGGVGLRLVREMALGLGGSVAHRRIDGRTEIDVTLPAAPRAEAA